MSRVASYTHSVKRTLTAAALLLLAGSPAWAGPTDQLRVYTDQVIKVLDDPALARENRRAAIRKLAHEAFDVTEAAKRVLARHWQARTPAEREEFAELFADLLERTYIARLDEYGGERIRYVGESVDGELATVRARIVTRTGTEVPVESRMVRRGERWLDRRRPHREREPHRQLPVAVRPDHPGELLPGAGPAPQAKARRVPQRVGAARPSILGVGLGRSGSDGRPGLIDFET